MTYWNDNVGSRGWVQPPLEEGKSSQEKGGKGSKKNLWKSMFHKDIRNTEERKTTLHTNTKTKKNMENINLKTMGKETFELTEKTTRKYQYILECERFNNNRIVYPNLSKGGDSPVEGEPSPRGNQTDPVYPLLKRDDQPAPPNDVYEKDRLCDVLKEQSDLINKQKQRIQELEAINKRLCIIKNDILEKNDILIREKGQILEYNEMLKNRFDKLKSDSEKIKDKLQRDKDKLIKHLNFMNFEKDESIINSLRVLSGENPLSESEDSEPVENRSN